MTRQKITMTDIPAASPYYDRIRSLNIQLDFCPIGSPEYQCLIGEIDRMEQRARKRVAADRSVTVF